MNDGSDTWVIVLAAFGGGLAGAILQPLLNFLLQRVQSEGQVRKSRERRLRGMVEAWLKHGVRTAITAFEVEGRLKAGAPPLAPDVISERIGLDPGTHPLWQPYRIEDEHLRKLADEFIKVVDQYRNYCWKPTLDESAMAALAEQATELPRLITLRMDELNWPEVDG